MVTVHVLAKIPLQSPVQLRKTERVSGVAVRVTTVPLLMAAEQVPPQLIPEGLEVTVPPMIPVFVTVKVIFTVKLAALVAVPPGVVTLSGPVVAAAGTVAWIAVAEVTVKLALTPLNLTAVAPVKVVPVIVTTVPTSPLVGVKLVIVGDTVKLVALVAVPPGVVTLSGPDVAPAGTVA
jgi:hypothetical protein